MQTVLHDFSNHRANVLTVRPGNLEYVLNSLRHGVPAEAAGAAIVANQGQFLPPSAGCQNHAGADPSQAEGRGRIAWNFGALQAGVHAVIALCQTVCCTLVFEACQHRWQLVLERSSRADLDAQAAARAIGFDDFNAVGDSHGVVWAGLHTQIATADHLPFDQAPRARVLWARVGDFHDGVENVFQHKFSLRRSS